MSKEGDKEYNRALDLLEGGDLSGAIEAAESALMADSKVGDYWKLYSGLLLQAGRTEDAAKALEKGKELGLDEVDGLLLKASEAAFEKKWNKAVTACEEALELAPERADVWASYAANLMEGGYRKDALEASEKAVQLSGENGQIQYLRGRILRLQQDLDGAGEAFRRAVELEPELAIAWYEKGMVHHQKEELAEAKECFLKSKELKLADPGVDEALRILEEVN